MNQRIDSFLTYLRTERGLSPNTVSAYRNDLTQFAEFLRAEAARRGSGAPALATVDRERLAGFLLHLRERGYSAATIARKLAALKSFFHHLRQLGELGSDPTQNLGSPDVKRVPPRAISADDVRALIEQAQHRDTPDGLRDQAMLRLLAATGMRVSELVALDVPDLDAERATVRVVGRGGRERVLPLDRLTLASVQDYLARGRSFLARRHPEQAALILNHRGERLTRQGFWLILKALVRDAGLPVLVTPHTLRHSFAIHRVGEGLALEQLRRLMGHASRSTTQIYSQLAGPRAPQPTDARDPALLSESPGGR